MDKPQKQPNPTPKKRTRRLNRTGFRIKLLTMLGVAAAVVLGFLIFFKIQTVNVVFEVNGEELTEEELPAVAAKTGHQYYTAEEVIEKSGIQLGDNLLTLNKASVAASIKSELRYVSQVQVKLSFPSSVTLLITEFEISYAIQDETGSWWLINREGCVLDPATEQEAKTHLFVEGVAIRTPTPGKVFELVGADGADETELSAKKAAILQLLQTLEDSSEIAKMIVSIDVSASYDLSMWYGTQYQIRLGTTEELAYKFAYLEQILAHFKEQNQTNLSGVIDITFFEGRSARFQRFE